ELRARALAGATGVRLVAVADVRPELAQKAACYGSEVRVFSDGMELARQPDIDAVIIATPPVSHEKLGLACFAAGKHVFCEKPLGATPEACAALLRGAKDAGKTLATGFNLRYTRAAQLARQLLDDGEIGELDHVRAFHGHPGGAEFT